MDLRCPALLLGPLTRLEQSFVMRLEAAAASWLCWRGSSALAARAHTAAVLMVRGR